MIDLADQPFDDLRRPLATLDPAPGEADAACDALLIEVDEGGRQVLTSPSPSPPPGGLPVVCERELSMASESRPSSADAALPASTSAASSAQTSVATDGRVCPFCAYVRDAHAGGACPKCTMDDTPGTRRSTGERIGPWFVLQRKNPTAPGLRFSVLLTLARRGHVTARSIIRGPTTGQLWRYASEVKGLSRLFGHCWHCHRGVSPDATTCPHCRSAQEIPDDPDTFLESHAMLPVMREVMRELPAEAVQIGVDEGVPALPAPDGGSPDVRSLAARRREEHASLDRQRGENGQRANGERENGSREHSRPAPLPTRRTSPADAFDAPEDLGRALAAPRRPASRPLVPTGREAGEAILSASELAAVFQLQTNGLPPGARRPSRVWRAIRYAAAAALILGAAGAITATVRPEWAQLAAERIEPHLVDAQQAWQRTLAKIDWDASGGPTIDTAPLVAGDARGTGTPSKVGVTLEGVAPSVVAPTRAESVRPDWDARTASIRSAEVKNADATSVVGVGPSAGAASGRPIVPSLSDLRAEIDALAGQASIFVPTTRPVAVTPGSIARAPAAPRVTASPTPAEPRPEPPTPTPVAAQQAVSGPPKELTLEQATAQADELRRSALDAEARRDWRAAIIIWEQIATLPEAARPSDLKIRLQLAKDHLAS